MERGDVICVRHGYFQPTHCGVYVGEGHVVHMVAPNIFPCFMSCGSCPAVSCSCGSCFMSPMKSCGISSGCSSKQGTIPAGSKISSGCSSKQGTNPACCGISSGCSSKQGTIPAGFGRVQRDTIQSFQKGKEITVVRSWVLKPLSDEEIVRRCEKRVGDMIKFDPANYNCQHFANEMRYGQPVSYQVQATSAVGGAVLGSVAFVGGLAVAPALGVVAVGSAATYYIGSAISSKWSNCCRQRNKENVKQE